MSNYEATRYDFDASNVTNIEGINTGLIIPWSGSSIPSGFLECDGSAVSRTTYAALFAIIGTTYGSGDGSTTFNVPNLDGKVVKGKSPTTNLGTSVAANTVTCPGNISGSLGNTTLPVNLIGPHLHSAGNNNVGDNAVQSTIRRSGTGKSAGGGGAHNHNHNFAFTGSAVDVTQPINVTQYIIKT